MKTMYYCIAAVLLLTVSGCGRKEHQPPPLERTQLVFRFFNSMRKGDAVAASSQGRKIQELSGSDGIDKLVVVQESNVYVARAQSALNAGRLNDAIRVVDEGIRHYPLNRTLLQLRGRLRSLRNGPALLRAMREAKNSASMGAALTAAVSGFSGNTTPELNAYFAAYREELDRVSAKEREILEPAVPVVPAATPAPAEAPAAPVAPVSAPEA